MRLSDLGLAAEGGANPEITGLAVDSRMVRDGFLFAAMSGVSFHGAEFIAPALRQGAVAVLTDAEGAGMVDIPDGIALCVARDARLALARAAATFSGAQPENVVAVTGTNGKTSVATFTRQIWEALGLCAVNIGTTGIEGGFSAPLAHTTPEPITLHAILADMAMAGISHAAMEASSHGLAQRRLDAVRLTAAAFTNFTQDHLDYHADFDEYFAAKAGLFDRVLTPAGTAVICLDDPRGADMAAIARARGQRIITTGRDRGADIALTAQRFDATGQVIRFTHEGTSRQVRLDLVGGFQASNVLVAAGLAIAAGAVPGAVFDTLGALSTVRGRMQLAATRANGAPVYVDYAHTPDAVATALAALRPHVMGRLFVVLGAGGDRDRGKRPLMGKAAAENADVVYVSDDNPRTEEPAQIRAAIMAAAPEATEVGDRAEAILLAIDALEAGDALLIAGKGHETGQIIGTDVFPFNDAEQASVAVAALDGRVP